MKGTLNFKTYQSPFSWRYGSDEMRQLFSEVERRKTWRRIWVALARAQHQAGLLTKEEFADIEKNSTHLDIERALQIEKEIYHDLTAEIKTFAQKAKVGGGKIHLGATSTDITDNADILIVSKALKIVETKLKVLLKSFYQKINKYKNTVCMGYTHLQPAEPTTLGYRFSTYAQDLLSDLKFLRYFRASLRTKGIKGAVGTSASYVRLLQDKQVNAFQLEKEIMDELELLPIIVSGQTYPRKTDLHLMYVLTSIAQSLHKFCFDLRLMQSPNFGEWSEPRDKKRVGSSAMPFKRNPDKAEKICSLARYVSHLTALAFSNAANTLLERTLDDSANRRIFIPEGFLAIDEILVETTKLVKDLVIFEENVRLNLEKFGQFAGTENLMIVAAKRGASRQEFHEILRKISIVAWQAINQGRTNPLVDLLKGDKIITKFVKSSQVKRLIDPEKHTGLAKARCNLFLKELNKEFAK